MMITTAIFDMDGLLIDSEPLWRKVEINLFGSLGVPINEKRCFETMGLRTDECVNYWFVRYPWSGITEEDVVQQLDATIVELVEKEGCALPGVEITLKMMKKNVQHVALASSSKMVLIEAVLEKLNIQDYFEVVYSAEKEIFGKPHPGVYISTMKELDVAPSECIAFEDSINGVLSAKAARMKCIAIPDEHMYDNRHYAIADYKMRSLINFDQKMLDKILL